MDIKINELPDEIQFLAICTQIEFENLPNENLTLITNKRRGNFNWRSTKQGNTFWADVHESKEYDLTNITD